jgi:hypothetical protein
MTNFFVEYNKPISVPAAPRTRNPIMFNSVTIIIIIIIGNRALFEP